MFNKPAARVTALLHAGLAAVLLMAAPLVSADSSDAPPTLNMSSGSLQLNYVEGEIHFPNRSQSVQYIADASWQLCAMRGLQGSEDYEFVYVTKTSYGWYVYWRHWENNLAIWWYCVK